MPTMVQAGQYSSVYHYLKAVKAAGTDDTKKVMAQMKKTPINDFFAKNGQIRVDGRMVHDMYLMQVKKPADSKYPWDYYHVKSGDPGSRGLPAPGAVPLPAGQEVSRCNHDPRSGPAPLRPWSDPWRYSASHPGPAGASCCSG
jgi:hypothetical protein